MNFRNALSLISVLIIFLLSAYCMYSITFVLIDIAKAFLVSLSAVIVAVTLSWIGGALGGFIFGILADKFGRKKSLFISIFLYSIFTILVFIINNIYELYIIWFLVGVGVNGENGISYAVIAELQFTNLRGFAGGLMQGLYSIGSLIGAITAFLIVPSFGWRYLFLIAGLISLLSFLFWIWIPEEKWKGRVQMKISEIFSKDLRRLTIIGSILSLASFLYLIPAFSLMPSILQNLRVPTYDIVIAIADLISAIVYGIAGYLSDIKGRKRASLYFAILAFISSIIFILLINTDYIEFSVFLVYASSAFFAFFGVWMSELYPGKLRATGANFTLLIGRLIGGGFGPLLVSLIPIGLSYALGTDLIITSLLAIASISLL
ncbi:MFS transporter [Acidianus brierleyi]|uniref:MFS transporter n=1 Tax=Acidianus brierleyi TaxID=41673 RepID=A0A2U9IDM9_9CREN|nr:MFS transporter [Acidianus brierleyi]AWR94131.1 MFS transporter [Acidianus brierleyi]